MKAVLISIQPKWCELIANGKKTIEVRKTRPNLDTPFKVYIYCTHSKNGNAYCKGNNILNGRVIGEFVCDSIIQIGYNKNGYGLDDFVINGVIAKSCVPEEELYHYLQGKKPYLWHISDLIIYDKPKELSEFRLYNVRAYYDEELKLPMPTHEIKRPPQSWCYVEEMG